MRFRFVFLYFLLFSKFVTAQSFILLSKDKNDQVKNWIYSNDSSYKTVDFYSINKDSMSYFINNSIGIVICGGEDVNPKLYGKPEYTRLCGKIDNFRDSLELLLIDFAVNHNIPLLGICRGQQIINVALGGTLVPDIPTYFKSSTINHRLSVNQRHKINFTKGSWVYELTSLPEYMGSELIFFNNNVTYSVNSLHHQSIDLLSDKLKVSAQSSDGVIESIEWLNSENKSFLLGVQWHPELMTDFVSMSICFKFLKACYDHQYKK
jgi:putative glutamine amidotransferase